MSVGIEENDMAIEPPIRLLIGTDYPILKKIECAETIFGAYGRELLSDKKIKSLLDVYRQAIRQSWLQMEETGVVAECTDCATKGGASCCAKGIEDHFDATLLLINLLMGCELPSSRWDKTGCWFLGERGCRLIARHVICINYICRRLYNRIGEKGLQVVQVKMVEETDAGFFLEEAIKKWLRSRGI